MFGYSQKILFFILGDDMTLGRLTLSVIIEDKTENNKDYDEIGQFLAKDVENMLYNGEDTLEVDYMGYDIL